jgi:uncharacterized protein YbbK (DUF523 family)
MYLVSACLAGINCRYDGGNSRISELEELVKSGIAIALCPEVISGLGIPRIGCEIIRLSDGSRKVINKEGKDLTEAFIDGAQKTLDIVKILGINKAILKARSPSCGYGKVYNGNFNGKLIEGNGITADLLAKNGVEIYNEDNFRNVL